MRSALRESPEQYASKPEAGAQEAGLTGLQGQSASEGRHARHQQAEPHSAPQLAEPNLEAERAIATLPSVTTGVPKGARRVRVDLPIEGLDCATCAKNVGKALLSLPGVERADVNPSTQIATVAYDRTRVGLPQMSRAVRDAGYQIGLAIARLGIEGLF